MATRGYAPRSPCARARWPHGVGSAGRRPRASCCGFSSCSPERCFTPPADVSVTIVASEHEPDPDVDRRDRKSTRLNSSHGYISYAVFCLKKKKIDSSTTYDRYKIETDTAVCNGSI